MLIYCQHWYHYSALQQLCDNSSIQVNGYGAMTLQSVLATGVQCLLKKRVWQADGTAAASMDVLMAINARSPDSPGWHLAHESHPEPSDHVKHNRQVGVCKVPHVVSVDYGCPGCMGRKKHDDPSNTMNLDGPRQCRRQH